MSMAYIVSKNPGYDYDKVREYCDSVYYLTRGILNVGKDWNTIKSQFYEKLKDSEPDDKLVLVGANVLNVLAYKIMKEKHGHVNVLFWDVSQQYMEFKL